MESDSIEYVLFDTQWAKQFTNFLSNANIDYSQKTETDCVIISIADDLDEALDDLIETEYDRIMAAHEAEDTQVDEMNRVGIQYRNQANETRQVRADMAFVNRLLTVVSLDELQIFVQEVATEVEAGGDKRICEK